MAKHYFAVNVECYVVADSKEDAEAAIRAMLWPGHPQYTGGTFVTATDQGEYHDPDGPAPEMG